MNVNTVSQEWASRPDDQRFVSLDELRNSVANRTERATPIVVSTENMVARDGGGELYLHTKDMEGAEHVSRFNNWSMNQLATICEAPPKFLAKLPAKIAADCLNSRIHNIERAEHSLLLDTGNGESKGAMIDGVMRPDISNAMLRAVTSTKYGRIWDLEVVDSIIFMNLRCNNRWVVPYASYQAEDPKRATTIYGSDRDVFIFLVDPNNPVEINGKQKFRGFIASNSEVGAGALWLAKFLYDTVCDNRIVWGVEGYKVVRRRHTSLAPSWFADEKEFSALTAYAESSTAREVEVLQAAKALTVGKDEESVLEFIMKKTGYSKKFSQEALLLGEQQEGDPTKLWTVVSGLTARAREIPHSDTRVSVETVAGGLLELAT